MAVCERCDQEMTEAATCTAEEPRLRYGTEYPEWTREEYKARCHDCGVELGGIHHVECSVERCPKCGDRQRLWCAHRYN